MGVILRRAPPQGRELLFILGERLCQESVFRRPVGLYPPKRRAQVERLELGREGEGGGGHPGTDFKGTIFDIKSVSPIMLHSRIFYPRCVCFAKGGTVPAAAV